VELAKRNSLNQGNLDAALQDITQAAANTLEVEQVSVWLYNSDRSQIYCLDLYERSANRHSQGTELLAMHYPAYFRALETERILAVDDAHTDPRTLEFSESYLKRLGISSMLDAPIWLGGQVIGVVCHEQVGPKRQWGSEEQHFAASIADLVSLAIEARDRQRTEAELRASEERLQSFFNATFEGVLIHEQGQILDVNHAAETLFGYSTAELIGMSVFDLGTPEMHELFAQRLQVLSDQPFEAIGLRKDKATFVVEASGKSILYQGRPARVIGIRDITKRKQAEEELRLSAERDRLLAEISLRIRRSLDLNEILNTTVVEVRKFLQADRVFIGFIKGTNPSLHRHGEIVAEAVDPAWHSCLEVLIKDANYIRHMSMLFEQGEVRVVNNTAESQSSTTSWEYLARYRVCASLEVPIMLRGNAQLHCSHSQTNGHLSAKGTHEHQFFGVLVAHQCSGAREWQPFEIDLLEQLATRVAIAIQQGELYQQLATLNVNLERQVEERTALLQQKMQELQELSQLKDVFMHAVSHDLRTPVMGTLLVLKNLLNPPIRAADPSSEKLAELNRISETIPLPRTVLERMIQSNNRQLMLINSLLEAHASDVRGIVLHHEAVQLHSLIKAILEDLEPLLLKNQAVLSNLVPLDLPLVNIDPTQLRRVFENLIINALKHNPPGLSLTLKAMVEASMLRCTVEDNGVGINQEQAEHLFDLYFRGANARHLTGIGLGLYLCRQIITAHGGQIGVVSAPGAGATFWFTLPLALN
jgi:PAS domain S-box-containing protein